MTRRLAWRESKIRGGLPPGPTPDAIIERATNGWPPSKASPWQRVKSGDRLWVRENLNAVGDGLWKYAADKTGVMCLKSSESAMVAWAHHEERGIVPSIHMPRWASRLTLVVIATKIERLQNISAADAHAEGIYRQKIIIDGEEVDGWFSANPKGCNPTARGEFEALWVSLHGVDSWRTNPEVVALTFAVRRTNIDSLEHAA